MRISIIVPGDRLAPGDIDRELTRLTRTHDHLLRSQIHAVDRQYTGLSITNPVNWLRVWRPSMSLSGAAIQEGLDIDFVL